MVTTGTDDGANLVASRATQAIDILRPASTLVKLGMQVIAGLTGGTLLVPRIATSAEAAWPGETGTATASEPVLAQISASPKHIAGYCEISKQLLEQSPAIAERMVGAHLVALIANEIDKAALSGTGTSQPLGIVNTVGITKTARHRAFACERANDGEKRQRREWRR